MVVRQTWLMLAALLNKVDREHTLQAKQWADQAELDEEIELASALATVGVLWRNKHFAAADRVMEKLNREDSNHPRAHLWRLVLAAERGQTGALKFGQQRFPQADFLREEILIMKNAIHRYEQREDAQRRLEDAAINGLRNQ